MKMNVYVVSCHGEIDLVTSSYKEAVDFVSDDTLDSFGGVKFYKKLMNEYGEPPDAFIDTYKVEIPEELVK